MRCSIFQFVCCGAESVGREQKWCSNVVAARGRRGCKSHGVVAGVLPAAHQAFPILCISETMEDSAPGGAKSLVVFPGVGAVGHQTNRAFTQGRGNDEAVIANPCALRLSPMPWLTVRPSFARGVPLPLRAG